MAQPGKEEAAGTEGLGSEEAARVSPPPGDLRESFLAAVGNTIAVSVRRIALH